MSDTSCENCGNVIRAKLPKASAPVTFTACPRCGHKLKQPVTIGQHAEGDEGKPPRVYESLVEGND
jgi:hypothetical protein